MTITSLKKALKNSLTDDFEVGTVIRWKSGGVYNYAAIKTPAGWYTTAQRDNLFVPVRASFEKLVEILGSAETSEVAVATAWESVR